MKTVYNVLIKSTVLFFSLLLALNLFSQDKITLYGITLKSKEILGSEYANWGPIGSELSTQPLQPPTPSTFVNQHLGKIYSIKNFNNTKSFLDIILGISTPIADTINYTFYQAFSFQKLDRDVAFAKNPDYIKLKNYFTLENHSIAEKRVFLSSTPVEIKDALENTRYDVYQAPIAVTITRKLKKAFALGVEAKVDAALKNSEITLNADLTNQLKSTITRSMELKSGLYHQIKLHDIYVQVIAVVLNDYFNRPEKLNSLNDLNAESIRSFFKSADLAVITSAAVLESSFVYNTSNNFSLDIGATLKSNLSANEQAKIPKIAADIAAAFNINRDATSNIETGKSFSYIKYGYACALEIGNGRDRNCPQ